MFPSNNVNEIYIYIYLCTNYISSFFLGKNELYIFIDCVDNINFNAVHVFVGFCGGEAKWQLERIGNLIRRHRKLFYRFPNSPEAFLCSDYYY